MNALAPLHPVYGHVFPWLPAMVRLRGLYIGPDGMALRIDECGRPVVVRAGPRLPWTASYYPHPSIVSAR